MNVGSIKANISWVGAYDMVGNVWEWVNTIYDPIRYPYPYNRDDGREDLSPNVKRVVRGGSWMDSSGDVRAADRDGADPSGVWQGIGFRCVRDFQTGDLP